MQEGSHLAEKEQKTVMFFFSVTQKIESCFKSEFEIKSVKMSVKISRKKNDGLAAERERESKIDNFFYFSERSTHRYIQQKE